MPPANTFPGALNSWLNPIGTTLRNAAGYELAAVITQLQQHAAAIEAKLGYATSTPPASAAVLRRTATGQSAWGLVALGDIANDAVSNSALANDAVASAEIQNGAVTTAKLEANAASQSGYYFASSTISTTSGSESAMGSPPTQVTLTTTGADVLVWIYAAFGHTVANGRMVASVRVDSGTSAQVQVIGNYAAGAGVRNGIAGFYKHTSIPAGTHTFEFRYSNPDGGTLTVEQRGILAVELKR